MRHPETTTQGKRGLGRFRMLHRAGDGGKAGTRCFGVRHGGTLLPRMCVPPCLSACVLGAGFVLPLMTTESRALQFLCPLLASCRVLVVVTAASSWSCQVSPSATPSTEIMQSIDRRATDCIISDSVFRRLDGVLPLVYPNSRHSRNRVETIASIGVRLWISVVWRVLRVCSAPLFGADRRCRTAACPLDGHQKEKRTEAVTVRPPQCPFKLLVAVP